MTRQEEMAKKGYLARQTPFGIEYYKDPALVKADTRTAEEIAEREAADKRIADKQAADIRAFRASLTLESGADPDEGSEDSCCG